MADFFQQLTAWHWLGLAMILLISEMLGTAGYLLWIGVVSALVGAIMFAFPELLWVWQIVLFAVLSLVTVLLWRTYQTTRKPEKNTLNQRGSELIGRQFELHEAIVDGRGKIKAGDTLWMVTGADMPKGAHIRVAGQEGVILKVEAI